MHFDVNDDAPAEVSNTPDWIIAFSFDAVP